jgi:hypothetical protein
MDDRVPAFGAEVVLFLEGQALAGHIVSATKFATEADHRVVVTARHVRGHDEDPVVTVEGCEYKSATNADGTPATLEELEGCWCYRDEPNARQHLHNAALLGPPEHA